ncbi:hypothetical protein COO60DRAFT_1482640 [Scenedesmus sp. NREL 46B-D3]|nr:hypothetical protein COO60DRAFT_1482640 [Scenedesmus sp. NREL 46B-D3]
MHMSVYRSTSYELESTLAPVKCETQRNARMKLPRNSIEQPQLQPKKQQQQQQQQQNLLTLLWPMLHTLLLNTAGCRGVVRVHLLPRLIRVGQHAPGRSIAWPNRRNFVCSTTEQLASSSRLISGAHRSQQRGQQEWLLGALCVSLLLLLLPWLWSSRCGKLCVRWLGRGGAASWR